MSASLRHTKTIIAYLKQQLKLGQTVSPTVLMRKFQITYKAAMEFIK